MKILYYICYPVLIILRWALGLNRPPMFTDYEKRFLLYGTDDYERRWVFYGGFKWEK